MKNIFLFFYFLTSIAFSQNNVSGNWETKFDYSFGDAPIEIYELYLKQTGNDITGELEISSFPPSLYTLKAELSGSITKNDISLEGVMTGNGVAPCYLNGTLNDNVLRIRIIYKTIDGSSHLIHEKTLFRK